MKLRSLRLAALICALLLPAAAVFAVQAANPRDLLRTHRVDGSGSGSGSASGLDLSPLGFIRHCLGSFVGPYYTEEVARGNAAEISSGQKHPWQKCDDMIRFFGVKDAKTIVSIVFKVALNRAPTADELAFCKAALEKGYPVAQFIRDRFNDPACPWLARYGEAKVTDATIGNETLAGYNGTRFQKLIDLVKGFCDANTAYVYAAGHTRVEGFPKTTDCSGFTGSLIDKVLRMAGLPSPLGSWFPSSQNYADSRALTKPILGPGEYPPPNPRDRIQPGDIFVLGPPAPGKVGHVGIFMGYDRAGNPLIAHSTPSTVKAETAKYGHIGQSGVRVEIMPASYRGSRWRGIYRANGMDEALNKLSGI